MSSHGTRHFASLVALTVLIAAPVMPGVAAAAELAVTPQRVSISSFFSGARVTVTGDLPPGSQAVVTVRGKMIEEELMRKAHHWDLWLNSGEIDIDNAPRFYVASSSDPALLRSAAPYPWGYASIERKVRFSGQLKPAEDDDIFHEFVRLMEHHHLYHLCPGEVQITQSSPDRWRFEDSVHLPSRIRCGTYYVSLWIVQDGLVIGKQTTTFQVEREGLPAFLFATARDHGVLYGLMAVGLAMLVGILTGVVFQRHAGGR